MSFGYETRLNSVKWVVVFAAACLLAACGGGDSGGEGSGRSGGGSSVGNDGSGGGSSGGVGNDGSGGGSGGGAGGGGSDGGSGSGGGGSSGGGGGGTGSDGGSSGGGAGSGSGGGSSGGVGSGGGSSGSGGGGSSGGGGGGTGSDGGSSGGGGGAGSGGGSSGNGGGPTISPNLIPEDGTFESGVSDFFAPDASSKVAWSAQSPLEGTHSLSVSIAGYGNNIWWTLPFSGGLASKLIVTAHLRSDQSTASNLEFCAWGDYANGTEAKSCHTISGASGDKGIVTAEVTLDPAKSLKSVRISLSQVGSAPVKFTLDEAVARLEIIRAPSDGGDGGGGGGSGSGSGGDDGPSCQVRPPGTSKYPGFTYHLPTARPFVSLASFTHPDLHGTAYTRFKKAADDALAGHEPYLYSAAHSVYMYAITGEPKYINDAIAREEAMVTAAEAAIAKGDAPDIAHDSYLDSGFYIENLALTYDYGFDRLSATQKQRWAAFAERTLQNLRNPSQASWGGVAHPWSGWSTCDPGDNYYYSFVRAYMLWALASQSTEWLSYLQTQELPLLIDYFDALPDGGSREGTGYGTALHNLFKNYIYWKDSTGEDLANLIPHTRKTIDYWVHATVPKLDRFAPIGDQSRSSIPYVYDYHRNLVHAAVVLSAGTPEAKRGTWWLQHNSLRDGVSSSFNLYGDLLPFPDTAQAPTDTVYHATDAGVLFARSSWTTTDASWLSIVAGKYDQSHAHQEEGSFTFFGGDWLAVTSNIWSHSGIHQETIVHNVLRFERNGSIIPQSQSSSLQSTMTYTTSGSVVSVDANLTNAYWRNADAVQSWTRNLQYSGQTLRVTDACIVASGVKPVFQLHVPVEPLLQQGGSVVAGKLRIVPLQSATPTFVKMRGPEPADPSDPPPEFSQGYRIDFRPAAGCSFSFQLEVLP
jgi:hypothetical protein